MNSRQGGLLNWLFPLAITTGCASSAGDVSTGSEGEQTDTQATGNSYCGDGVRDPGESCDGDDLDGKTCQYFTYPFGELHCDEFCEHDASECSTCANAEVSCAELEALSKEEVGEYDHPHWPLPSLDGIDCSDGVDQGELVQLYFVPLLAAHPEYGYCYPFNYPDEPSEYIAMLKWMRVLSKDFDPTKKVTDCYFPEFEDALWNATAIHLALTPGQGDSTLSAGLTDTTIVRYDFCNTGHQRRIDSIHLSNVIDEAEGPQQPSSLLRNPKVFCSVENSNDLQFRQDVEFKEGKASVYYSPSCWVDKGAKGTIRIAADTWENSSPGDQIRLMITDAGSNNGRVVLVGEHDPPLYTVP